MELKKIQELIKKKNLTFESCEYHTQRKLENGGKIRVLVLHGTAHVEYICPRCGHYEYLTKPWKRPFSVKCGNCGHTIKVQKMRYLIKKEMKNL